MRRERFDALARAMARGEIRGTLPRVVAVVRGDRPALPAATLAGAVSAFPLACRADQERDRASGACHCPPGATECDGACRVLALDRAHCGGCGRSCDSANPQELCFAGECCLAVGAACAATGTPCCLDDLPVAPTRCGTDGGARVCCLAGGQVCSRDGECCSGSCRPGSGPQRRCAPSAAGNGDGGEREEVITLVI